MTSNATILERCGRRRARFGATLPSQRRRKRSLYYDVAFGFDSRVRKVLLYGKERIGE